MVDTEYGGDAKLIYSAELADCGLVRVLSVDRLTGLVVQSLSPAPVRILGSRAARQGCHRERGSTSVLAQSR